jgi:hypothetical protein
VVQVLNQFNRFRGGTVYGPSGQREGAMKKHFGLRLDPLVVAGCQKVARKWSVEWDCQISWVDVVDCELRRVIREEVGTNEEQTGEVA